MIEIRHHQGLHLPAPDLWLDPRESRPHAFVSHAHSDHFARHGRILCSETTALLLRARFRVAPERLQPLAFHQTLVLGGLRLRLLPAGHIAGSSMLHVSDPRGQGSLLYTGDFKIRPGRTSGAAHLVHAETLVMETTFGLPRFALPPQMEVEMAVLRFAHDAFRDGVVPVLLAYSLGKAQEVLALLHEHGIPALSHPAVAGMTDACRQAGIALPPPVLLEGGVPPGHAVVAPPNALHGKPLRAVAPKRAALLTGWALEPGTKWRHRVEEAIPLSDHADHPGLLECVRRVRPKLVLTVHGFAHEFATELRARGIDAWSAAGHDQLELAIRPPGGRAAPAPPQAPATTRHSRPICPLADFSDLCRLMDETHSRVAKRGFIANYLRGLEADDELRLATRWLADEGRWQAARPRPAALAVIVRRALLGMPGAREERLRELARVARDTARAARLLLQELPLRPEPAGLGDTDAFLCDFAATRAAHLRVEALAARLSALHPAEAEALLRLLGGPAAADRELLDQAIAEAFGADAAGVARARQLTGSAAESAVLARYGRLAEATLCPGTAVPFMAATTRGELPAAAPGGEFATRESPWWIEPLCRGTRVHLHLRGGTARLFDATGRAADQRLAGQLAAGIAAGTECILDGVLGSDSLATGAGEPSQGELFAPDEPTAAGAAPRLLAFDLLWSQGVDLTSLSLEERRAHLLALGLREPLQAVPVARAADREGAAQALAAAIRQGCAGVVCKDPASPYCPGQRSSCWIAVVAREA